MNFFVVGVVVIIVVAVFVVAVFFSYFPAAVDVFLSVEIDVVAVTAVIFVATIVVVIIVLLLLLPCHNCNGGLPVLLLLQVSFIDRKRGELGEVYFSIQIKYVSKIFYITM